MVYRKKRRTYAKRGKTGYLTHASNALSIAQKAYSGYLMLKKMLNVEKKFFDVSFSAGAIPLTATLTPITLVAEGNDYNQRAGISIKMNSIQWRIKISLGATPLPNTIRFLLFIDNECAGATASLGDLLENTAIPTVSPLNHVNGKRFKILNDSCVQISPNGDEQKWLQGFIKLNNHVKYQGTTGVIANAREGNLFFLLVSDQATVASQPVADGLMRTRFIDN